MIKNLEESIKTCLHRLLGDCKKCERDYENEINNTHCPKYYEVNLRYLEIKE